MVKIKFIDIATILVVIDSIFIIFMGLMYLFTGTFQSYHIDFTGLTAADVASFNAELMVLISVFIRIIGTSTLTAGIAFLIIAIIPFRKKEKWAWLTIVILGGFLMIAILTITYVILATQILYIVFILALILWILSVILSTYDIYFKKEM